MDPSGALKPPLKQTNRHTEVAHAILPSSCVSSLTCGGPDGPDEDGGHSHDEAPESSQEGEDLGVGSRGGRQDSLEIDLPGYSSKHLQYI